MEMLTRYFDIYSKRFHDIVETQKGALDSIKMLIKDVVINDKLIYMFGTGHSHAIAEEFFYRAGSLACISAILEEPLMVHAGAVASTQMERMEGYAQIVLAKYHCTPGDAMFIFSNSGINSVPLEMAQEAKKLGLTVVAFTSLDHSNSQTPRNKAGLRLHEVVDICLNTGILPGDAAITLPNGFGIAPISTVICDSILHGVFAQAAYELCQESIDVPVYTSANIQGGEAQNQKYIEKYQLRIRCL